MSAIFAELAPPPVTWRRPAICLGLVLLALLGLYFGTAAAMVGVWSRSDTFAHAFLVPPMSVWLIWRGRDRLAVLRPQASPVWLIPLALAALLWLAGKLAVVNALMQFALVAMLVLCVPLMLGWPSARAMLFPLLFLFFCVPVGEFLLPSLMEATADFTVAALRFSGIPVFREGLNFVIPSGNWSVVEACSGVRYLIASMMVGSVFAYLNYQSLTRRLLFFSVSIIVPILANWLRAYMIVMLGHLSNNRIATGVDHLVYGWVFFGVVITIMFMIGARWSEPDRVPLSSAGNATDGLDGSKGRSMVVVAGLLAVGLLALPQAAVRTFDRAGAAGPVSLAWPPGAQPGWTVTDRAPSWRPRFNGAEAYRQATYEAPGRTVGALLAYYRGQGDERKLVSSNNSLVAADDPVWGAVNVKHVDTLIDGTVVRWRATHLINRSGGLTSQRRQLTVWQVYWVDGHFTSNDVEAKLRGMWGVLAGRGDDGAALVLHTESEPHDRADQLLSDFVVANLPALRLSLQQAHAAR